MVAHEGLYWTRHVQGALKAKEPRLELLNQDIDVNAHAGIFVTLNPAGKGYGGRSKLPDNLKALFRSVAMTLPDNEIIAEVLLLASGFATARRLGRYDLTSTSILLRCNVPPLHLNFLALHCQKHCLYIISQNQYLAMTTVA